MLQSRNFIATPAYRGEVVMQYAHSIVRDTVLALGSGHFIEAPFFINDTYVHYARNHSVKAFLEQTEADNLIFIDADMGWEAGALVKLIEAEGDIVAGLYPLKGDPPYYPFNADPALVPLAAIAPIHSGPTGFMKITRACAQAMWDRFDGEPFAFEGGCGEDIAFCNRARALGFSIFGLFDIEFEHVGPKVWKGRAIDHLRAQHAA
jgi:glycosyltransferase involved in cell wall biosynthesis